MCYVVENIVFCRVSSLQMSIYKHLLESALVKSCLRSRAWNKGAESGPSHHQKTPPHLVCITALKKLCNDHALVYMAAREKEEGRPLGEDSEATYNGQDWWLADAHLSGLSSSRTLCTLTPAVHTNSVLLYRTANPYLMLTLVPRPRTH